MAEKYRTPVILLTDAIVGHMRERVEIPSTEDIKLYNRLQPRPGLSDYKPYDAAGAAVEGVPPMANIGDGYRHYISGCTHDETGSPKMNSYPVARGLVGRLCDKIKKNRDDIVMCESFYTEDADILVIAYGSVARPAYEAVSKARKAGKSVGFFRPISLWPSLDKEILAAAEKAKVVLIPEMNDGQYAGEVCRVFGEAGRAVKIVKLDEIGSEFIHPDRIYNTIREVC
jgi:2-oxoglutarate ferredoxin oxidoreductase subunit alpha